MKPRLLDLFCGAGGAAMGYHRAGFEVVGVDIEPQPNYPFLFIQGDALEAIEDDMPFDAIHASPPCQAYSSMKTMRNAREHPDLVGPTRELLMTAGLPYVIENVVGAPLLNAVSICGASLGLGTDAYQLARHRLFECSFPLMVAPCAHGSKTTLGVYGDHARDRTLPTGQLKAREGMAAAQEAMGIDWMTWHEMAEAIPPAYTEHVGNYLMAHLKATAKAGTM